MREERTLAEIDKIASDFLERFHPGDWAREEIEGTPAFGIDPNQIDDLTANVMLFIAEVIASIIDTGSEREAVLENEVLHDAIRQELSGWTYEGKTT
jgi:hypothetical protein